MSSQPMCNAGYTISILCAAAVLFAKAAFAADGDSLPPADLFSRVQAVLQSGEFMAGIIGGAVAIHLVHLMWQAGKRAMTHTFFLGRRTLHYGVAAAVIGGLILLI